MIELKDLNKSFKVGKDHLHAVRDVNLTIDDGDIYGIIGFSGAGKSTLVRCINLLERPTSGSVLIDGVDLTKLGNRELREARKNIGMIFQQFNLLSQRTVEANIRYPLELNKTDKSKADKRVKELLELVDLTEKAKAYPAQLSGGQKQRVAIARALASDPKIILCDEATSALDPITTRSILDLLKSLNEKLGVTIVVITHEMRVVEQICHHVAVMSDGQIQEKGSVRDVFLKPQSETARKLIEPNEGEGGIRNRENTLRLAFTGDESGDPVISDMTIKCGVMVNILAANTEEIGGKTFGQMLIELPKDESTRRKIEEYLTGRGIYYEIGKPVETGDSIGDGIDDDAAVSDDAAGDAASDDAGHSLDVQEDAQEGAQGDAQGEILKQEEDTLKNEGELV